VVSATSDGVNYVVISEDGSALVATSGSFSGNVDMNGGGIIGNASGIFTFCSIIGGSFPPPSASGRFVYCHENGIPYNAGFIFQNNL
jgi:hypothetical protein